jgi:hypothetical protein
VTGRTRFLSLGLLVCSMASAPRACCDRAQLFRRRKETIRLHERQTAFEFDALSEAISLQLSLFAASVRLAALIQL